jgi:hypothetical protein
MPNYIIQRDVPGFGSSTPQQLADAAAHSNATIAAMGHTVQWLHSYVTDEGTYCVYIAPDIEAILEHSRRSGFPANKILEVRTIIDPTTGE